MNPLSMGLLGFISGYFLSFTALVVITGVCLAIFAVMCVRLHEMETLLTYFFGVSATIGNLCMWVTYYVATKQHWIGDLFQSILR